MLPRALCPQTAPGEGREKDPKSPRERPGLSLGAAKHGLGWGPRGRRGRLGPGGRLCPAAQCFSSVRALAQTARDGHTAGLSPRPEPDRLRPAPAPRPEEPPLTFLHGRPVPAARRWLPPPLSAGRRVRPARAAARLPPAAGAGALPHPPASGAERSGPALPPTAGTAAAEPGGRPEPSGGAPGHSERAGPQWARRASLHRGTAKVWGGTVNIPGHSECRGAHRAFRGTAGTADVQGPAGRPQGSRAGAPRPRSPKAAPPGSAAAVGAAPEGPGIQRAWTRGGSG